MGLFCYNFDSDRANINAIKRDPNIFRNKIVALLQDGGQDGEEFRARLGELHNALEQAQISNQERIVSFHMIRFKNEGDNISEAEKRRIHFHVHCGDRTHPFDGQTVLTIKGHRRGGVEFTHFSETFPEYEYDLQKVSKCVSKVPNEGWRQEIMFHYKRVAPLLMKSLVSGRPNSPNKPSESILCGKFSFIPNAEMIAQGLIEVLYNLRNALFHGEITPNKDANKVYAAAYHLLRSLIDCL